MVSVSVHTLLKRYNCMTPDMTTLAGMSRQLVGSDVCAETAAALGTVSYSAPEVFDNGAPMQASDAYAFGILRESLQQWFHICS